MSVLILLMSSSLTSSGLPPPDEEAPTLGLLSISSVQYPINAAQDAVLANITGKTVDSTINIIEPSDGSIVVSVDGTQLLRGATAWTEGNIEIVLEETLAGATNTPRSSVFGGVILPFLNALTVSNTSFDYNVAEDAVLATVSGAHPNSVVTLASPTDGSILYDPVLKQLLRGPESWPAGASNISLLEVLEDAVNSPRTTTIGITVNATLNALAISETLYPDTAAENDLLATLSGITRDSTVELLAPLDGKIVLNPLNTAEIRRGATPLTVGSFNIQVRETLAGASNSPRITNFIVDVYEVGSAVVSATKSVLPTGSTPLDLDLTDVPNGNDITVTAPDSPLFSLRYYN